LKSPLAPITHTKTSSRRRSAQDVLR
jgi:hypothetical protein